MFNDLCEVPKVYLGVSKGQGQIYDKKKDRLGSILSNRAVGPSWSRGFPDYKISV